MLVFVDLSLSRSAICSSRRENCPGARFAQFYDRLHTVLWWTSGMRRAHHQTKRRNIRVISQTIAGQRKTHSYKDNVLGIIVESGSLGYPLFTHPRNMNLLERFKHRLPPFSIANRKKVEIYKQFVDKLILFCTSPSLPATQAHERK